MLLEKAEKAEDDFARMAELRSRNLQLDKGKLRCWRKSRSPC